MNGPEDCDCYYCLDKIYDKGYFPCEYYNHHCESCHNTGMCTNDDCIEFFQKKQGRVMGIDYFQCDACGNGFRDDDEYCAWCDACGNKFCSEDCGKLENYVPADILEKYWEDFTYNGCYDEDRRYNKDEPMSCVICRREKYTDHTLLMAILKKYNLSIDDAIKIHDELNDE